MDAEPVNELDRIARRHDIRYGEYKGGGLFKNRYFLYNRADEQFIEESKHIGGVAAIVSRGVFRVKGAIMPKMEEKRSQYANLSRANLARKRDRYPDMFPAGRPKRRPGLTYMYDRHLRGRPRLPGTIKKKMVYKRKRRRGRRITRRRGKRRKFRRGRRRRGKRGGLRSLMFKLDRLRAVPRSFYEHDTTQFSYGVNQCIYQSFATGTLTDLSPVLAKITSGTDNRRFMVHRMFSVVNLRHNTICGGWVQFFWMTPRVRMSINQDPFSVMNAADNLYTDTDFMSDPGSSPLAVPELVRMWRVKKGRPFFMEAGQSMMLTLRPKRRNFMFKERDWDADSVEFMPGITKFLFMKAWGPVGVDDTTATQVGTAAGRIDAIVTFVCGWKDIPQPEYDVSTGTDGRGALAAGWKGMYSTGTGLIDDAIAV